MVKIEKNVPIPVARHGAKQAEFPWDTMQISDSFFAPDTLRTITYLQGRAYFFGRKFSKKFVTRSVTVKGKLGTRVWRVEYKVKTVLAPNPPLTAPATPLREAG